MQGEAWRRRRNHQTRPRLVVAPLLTAATRVSNLPRGHAWARGGPLGGVAPRRGSAQLAA